MIRVAIRYQFDGYAVYIFEEKFGKIYEAKPFDITFVETDKTAGAVFMLPDTPTFMLSRENFYQIAQELKRNQDYGAFNLGLNDFSGEKSAMKNHIEDLRKVTFTLLDK